MTRDERLVRLEKVVSALSKSRNLLAEQLAEQNLRLRLVMMSIRMRRAKPGALVDPATNKPQVEETDLYTLYMTGGREQALATLEAEMQAALAKAEAEAEQQLLAHMDQTYGETPSSPEPPAASPGPAETEPGGDGEAPAARTGTARGQPGANGRRPVRFPHRHPN